LRKPWRDEGYSGHSIEALKVFLWHWYNAEGSDFQWTRRVLHSKELRGVCFHEWYWVNLVHLALYSDFVPNHFLLRRKSGDWCLCKTN
jgi:hypothetical protein